MDTSIIGKIVKSSDRHRNDPYDIIIKRLLTLSYFTISFEFMIIYNYRIILAHVYFKIYDRN